VAACFFVGAGTSGRLGVLEAAECPPTFGTPPRLVQGDHGGRPPAVFRSREGAEDDARAAARAVAPRVRHGDVVVGVSASGVTPFVRAALAAARRRGARTVLVACNPDDHSRRPGRRHHRARVGPGGARGLDPAQGRHRHQARSQHADDAAMARLGKVYGNRMVDLRPRSAKLRERAVRVITEIAGVRAPRARRALAESGGSVRVAIVMARSGLSARAPRGCFEKPGAPYARRFRNRRGSRWRGRGPE